MKTTALLLALAAPVLLHAAANEDDLFGGTDAKPSAGAAATPAPSSKDEAGMASAGGADAFSRGDTKEDPLDIGGAVYQRASTTFNRGLTEGEQPFSLPLQVDLYLDGRPSERVRSYVKGRLLYDSTLDAFGKASAGRAGFPVIPTATSFTAAVATPSNPQVVLDQAWIKFDLARSVFISLGKQHVKWGTGRLWNPSDALNPQRRDPLQPYDLRLGSNMLSVQVPWEAEQANLYGIVLFDNPQPASTLQQLGGAVRVEGLLGPAEIGLSAVGRAGELPRYGVDLSTPLGPFDFYSEAAFLANDGRLGFYNWHGVPPGTPAIWQLFDYQRLPGAALQIVGGLEYTGSWRESRSATVALEYFYNELGSSDGHMYPILLYYGQYTPFYLGRHYAALALRAEGPDSGKKSSYNLSTLANLDDKSAVTRLDVTYLLHDSLTIGAWGSLNYGSMGGEFNFNLDTPALAGIPAVYWGGTSGEAGLSARLSF